MKFGDVVRQTKEDVDPETSDLDRYVAGEHMNTDDLHIRRWGNVGEGYLGPAFHRRFAPGQVLYGSRRTYLRKVAYAEFEGICANTTFVLEPYDPNVLLPELLPFIMQAETFHAYSISQSRGSVNPYINFRDIASYKFPLPPLDEQRRIAEILWAADETVQSFLVVQQAAEKTLRCVASSALQTNWNRSPAKDIFQLKTGSTPLRMKRQRYFEEGTIPWVKTLDLNEGWIVSTEEKITEIAIQESGCEIHPAGTVLVAMYGGWNQIGRTGLLKIPATTNQAVCALLPSPMMLPEFALLVLQINRNDWRRVAASSRKDPNITKSDVGRFLFPVPSIEEQQRIYDLVALHERAIASARTNVNRLLLLGRSLAEESLSSRA